METITENLLDGLPRPATTCAPDPTLPGYVVHSLYDISMYACTAEVDVYDAAKSEEEKLEALRDMPLATVQFYELVEGEPLFDVWDETNAEDDRG
jgi:hypothetical protein